MALNKSNVLTSAETIETSLNAIDAEFAAYASTSPSAEAKAQNPRTEVRRALDAIRHVVATVRGSQTYFG